MSDERGKRQNGGALTDVSSSSIPPLHRSTVPPFHRSTAPPLHRSTAPPLHRSTAPPFHRSTVPPFHRSTGGQMNRLELSLAWRYMRSRRGSKLLSVISLIAIGGV